MKNLLTLTLASVLLIGIIPGCKKENTGPVGPPVPSDKVDVLTINYSSQTFTGTKNYVITNISKERIDSSLVLAYYNPATEDVTSWYPVPGSGPNAAYETRNFIYQSSTAPSAYTMGVRLMTPAGAAYGTQVTFTKFKIIIIRSATLVFAGRGGEPLVDLSDYYAVKAFFGLKD
ncbi:MAG TPA: hypothetical protein VFO70_03365 [Chitinophagaceae bacterium]|nr:hypothetical protein [Chitinophagaceae bacterium]